MSSFSTSRLLAALAVFFALPPIACAAALPPLDPEDRWRAATLVVDGVVEKITMRVVPTANGTNREYTAVIRIERVLKGAPADTVRISATYWHPEKRPEHWTGDGGQRGPVATGARLRFFLREPQPGRYRLLNPNGAERLVDFSADGIALTYPEDWTVETTPISEGLKISVAPPEWVMKQFGVVVEIRPVEVEGLQSPEEALARLIAETREAPEGTVHEQHAGASNGPALVEAILSWKDDPRQSLAFKDRVRFLRLPGGRLLHAVYSSSTADFATFDDDARSILDSIRDSAGQVEAMADAAVTGAKVPAPLARRWLNTNSVFRGILTIAPDGAYTWSEPDDFWKERSNGRIEVEGSMIRFIAPGREPVACRFDFDPNALVKLKLTPEGAGEAVTYFFSD
jgi:hypothetical protein